MAIAIVLAILTVGTVLFHFLSPWYFTPIASNWSAMDDTVNLTFIITGLVFVAVNSFLVYCIVRFRRRDGAKAAYEPENKKLESWLTIVTAVGVAAMLAPGLFVWANFVTVPEDAALVEVVGMQWSWLYRFPGKDGTMGTVDARFISDDNPFGMNPDDPNGRDDVLVENPELHLPLGQPVKLLLRSVDVLHNFTVPQFRGKMDLVPGQVTFFWLEPTRTGRFDLLCEELCGIAHFAMRGAVVVEEPDEFDAWLDRQPTYAETQARSGNAVAGAPLYAICSTCHGANGEGNQALHSPNIAGHEAWYVERQLRNFKHGLRGTHEDDVWGKTMAPMVSTLVDDAAIRNVSAYVEGLPAVAAVETIEGDSEIGERIYNSTCSYCHGAEGNGRRLMNVPALADMNDWYLAEQLHNFAEGIRGSHDQDLYGAQMALMVSVLRDEKSIHDVVAYINSL